MKEENLKFNNSVDSWVRGLIENGVTNFNSLINSLPGVYPSVAFNSLKRLAAAGDISKQFSLSEIQKTKNGHKNYHLQNVNGESCLPVPHPLDYDWRFSDSATTYLLDYCFGVMQPNETIALLGTPSIYSKAKEISFPGKIILFDNNTAVIKHLSNKKADINVIDCDITNDRIPEIETSVVIADPPWYEEHLQSFIWTAAKICRLDGHILISLPPVGTRPEIESELNKLLEWTKQLGLILIKEEKGILPYVSPPFEINALKTENFHNLNNEWRRGDLTIFVKKEHTSVERPSVKSNTEKNWLEESVQGVRIKLKPYKELKFNDPKLLTIVKDDIFPTVSRRDSRRRLVEVWTSGNRVFACKGRFVLQEILRELSLGQSTTLILSDKLNRRLTKEENNIISNSKKQLLEIINIEREEIKVSQAGNNK